MHNLPFLVGIELVTELPNYRTSIIVATALNGEILGSPVKQLSLKQLPFKKANSKTANSKSANFKTATL